ncbi:biotin-dependent carboxyltransferase family protein [Rhizobium leguminosarum]|uniref:5-oxoprolinase subunit C family protein n=1 Tax=Rhizobium leguminosarum TaxID=384 RepID=UPI001C986ED3|nr:biotin-dependent carboxyltransferase family protein [Rhizobium leguminosarum]MBY5416534.1 biotin-dependent carboxyltransferase family protein [Rhizobium leguminosarum]
MTGILIKQAGPMLTVQDLGRIGMLHLGVSGSGPMDGPSMRIANRLVGNDDGQAVLEFAHVGGHFEVAEPVRFAVTGGAVEITVDGERRHGWESFSLLPGQVLKIGAMRDAVWGYLALSGGIETPPVLGSRSTHLRTGIGGLDGRRLSAGDRLPLGVTRSAPMMALRRPFRRPLGPVRVVKGPQGDHFDAAAWRDFLETGFVVSANRDRMAQMLEGPAVRAVAGHDIVSDGTVSGSIQVPASGRPIVLMAERQTTGGYPKIATVASIDLPRLAQAMTGASLRFKEISQDEAETLFIAQSQALIAALSGLEEKSGTAGLRREPGDE